MASSETTRRSTRNTLERHLETIRSRTAADAVVACLQAALAQVQEADAAEGRALADQPAAAADQSAAEPQAMAYDLVTVVSRAVGRGEAAAATADAVYEVFGHDQQPLAPAAAEGRALLRAAVLDQQTRLAALQGRLVLLLNGLPHTRWSDRVLEVLDGLSINGAPWLAGTLLAWWRGAPGGRRALLRVAPAVLGAAGVAQATKLSLAPRRPFVHEVEMAILGVKPRARSFPSGHTATWVAGAVALGSVWPRLAPAFGGLAALVSLSRVYLGAHAPDEVAAGAVLGAGLGAAIVAGVGTSPLGRRY